MSVESLWFDSSRCFVDNEWIAPVNHQYLELYNPSDGSVLCQIARGDSDDVDIAVESASRALNGIW